MNGIMEYFDMSFKLIDFLHMEELDVGLMIHRNFQSKLLFQKLIVWGSMSIHVPSTMHRIEGCLNEHG